MCATPRLKHSPPSLHSSGPATDGSGCTNTPAPFSFWGWRGGNTGACSPLAPRIPPWDWTLVVWTGNLLIRFLYWLPSPSCLTSPLPYQCFLAPPLKLLASNSLSENPLLEEPTWRPLLRGVIIPQSHRDCSQQRHHAGAALNKATVNSCSGSALYNYPELYKSVPVSFLSLCNKVA